MARTPVDPPLEGGRPHLSVVSSAGGFSEDSRAHARDGSEEGPEEGNPGGRPPHAPTDAQRALVTFGTFTGASKASLARLVGVHVETLEKHYAHELVDGLVSLGATLGQRAVSIARDPKDPKGPDMLKYLLSTKFGFKAGEAAVGAAAAGDEPERVVPVEKWTVSIGEKKGA